jgi:hypothetical protein
MSISIPGHGRGQQPGFVFHMMRQVGSRRFVVHPEFDFNSEERE